MDETVIDAFEFAWQRGERPDIASLLPVRNAASDDLLAELIRIDWEYRIKRGETPSVDDYASRFPELFSARPEFSVLLLAETQRLRRRFRARARHHRSQKGALGKVNRNAATQSLGANQSSGGSTGPSLEFAAAAFRDSNASLMSSTAMDETVIFGRLELLEGLDSLAKIYDDRQISEIARDEMKAVNTARRKARWIALTIVLVAIGITIAIFWHKTESARSDAEDRQNRAIDTGR